MANEKIWCEIVPFGGFPSYLITSGSSVKELRGKPEVPTREVIQTDLVLRLSGKLRLWVDVHTPRDTKKGFRAPLAFRMRLQAGEWLPAINLAYMSTRTEVSMEGWDWRRSKAYRITGRALKSLRVSTTVKQVARLVRYHMDEDCTIVRYQGLAKLKRRV